VTTLQILLRYHVFFINTTTLTENYYKQAFKLVAKTLGTSLQEEAPLRLQICEGLTKLIQQNRASLGESSEEDSTAQEGAIDADTAKANVAAMATFSKNFLPCFFNIYGVCFNEQVRWNCCVGCSCLNYPNR
jgi:hypothetical protein